MSFELREPWTGEQVRDRLAPQCPPGLEILEVAALPEGARRPVVDSMVYQIRVPRSLQSDARRAASELMSSSEKWVSREGRAAPLNLRDGLLELALEDDCLRMALAASQTVSPRPREVLRAVGLGELESQGEILIRADLRLKADVRRSDRAASGSRASGEALTPADPEAPSTAAAPNNGQPTSDHSQRSGAAIHNSSAEQETDS